MKSHDPEASLNESLILGINPNGSCLILPFDCQGLSTLRHAFGHVIQTKGLVSLSLTTDVQRGTWSLARCGHI